MRDLELLNQDLRERRRMKEEEDGKSGTAKANYHQLDHHCGPLLAFGPQIAPNLIVSVCVDSSRLMRNLATIHNRILPNLASASKSGG